MIVHYVMTSAKINRYRNRYYVKMRDISDNEDALLDSVCTAR